MVAQVTNDAASLARKSNAEAISSGSPRRPSAVALAPSFAAWTAIAMGCDWRSPWSASPPMAHQSELHGRDLIE
jgi:hypothetical protein